MQRARLVVLLAAALVTVVAAGGPARAQTCPLGKHCFYVPPLMPNPTDYTGTGWDLVLASPIGTIAGTYTFGGGAATAFTVTQGTPQRVTLSAATGVVSNYAVVEQRGTFIVADRPDLSVVQRFVVGPWNSSATIKEATSSLGTRFRLGGYVLDGLNTPDTGHDIVSIYAPFGATVTIDPPGSDTTFWGDGYVGDARTVTLGVGQTVLYRTRNASNCGVDISGGLVTADAPISVITGGRGWAATLGVCNAYTSGGCGDDGVDHIIPESLVGATYVIDVYPGSTGRVTVVATVGDTHVSLNGSVVATLAAGELHRFAAAGLTLVTADAPVYVYQDAGLQSCEPGLSIIPPIAFSSAASLGIDVHVNGSGVASVFVPTSYATTVRLDDAVPTGVSSATVPGRPDLTRVRFGLTGGDHRVSADGDFQLGLATAASGTGLFAYYNPFRVPGCGDGTQDASEACDDGNVDPGDGCSPQCRLEVGEPGCDADADCVAAAFCQDGVCVARCFTTADCADGNPCTTDLCEESGACSNVPLAAGAECDAGGVCDPAGDCVPCYPDDNATLSDPGCDAGDPYCVDRDGPGCVGCLADAAGAGVDSGCDAAAPRCDEASDTCVACLAPSDCDDGDPCTADACDGGVCARTTIQAGDSCGDGVNGVCDAAGTCVPCLDDTEDGVDSGCSEAQPFCPLPAGDLPSAPALGPCVACLVAGHCDDADLCTTDSCVAGACAYAPVAPVPTVCGVGACAAVGEIRCADNAMITDCTPGQPAASDASCDGVDDDCDNQTDEEYAATQVACPSCRAAGMTSCVAGAEQVPACAPITDGTACDGGACALAASCQAGACVPSAYRSCDDGDPCTADHCDAALGCTATPRADGTPCDDEDGCTVADACLDAACVGQATTCGPPGECELTGSCNPATGLCDYPFVTGCVVCAGDADPPILTCPAPLGDVACVAGGTAATLGEPTARDACSAVAVTSDAPEAFPPGLTVVTFTASDDAGNLAACTTSVTVVDSAPPTLSCPEAVTVAGDPELCGALVTLPVTASDGCDGADVVVLGADEAFYPPGDTATLVVAIDAAGNQALCRPEVHVTGLDGFAVVCDADLARVAPDDFCGYPDAVHATVSDACGVATEVSSAADHFPIGESLVEFTALRGDGATERCETRLVVTDETPPTVVCAGSAADPRELMATLAPTAADACGVVLAIENAACTRTVAGATTAEPARCDLEVRGGVLLVRDAPASDGGTVAVAYDVRATDPSGNETVVSCVVAVDPESLDHDQDGVADRDDNCPTVLNPDQADRDEDDLGDVCDPTPSDGIEAEGGGGCAGGGAGAGLVGLALLLGLGAIRRRHRGLTSRLDTKIS